MTTIISQSISDIEMKILKYSIYDKNNEDNPLSLWVSGSITGKINNCYKNMQAEWITKLMADSNVSAISASRDDFVNQVTNRSDYLDRYTQESGSLTF